MITLRSPETRSRTLTLLEALAEELVEQPSVIPLAADTDARSLQLAEQIARRFLLLPALPGEMTVVTKSIGTSSRDYSTITAWEADLDNGAIYSSGDDAVGEVYNDSAFDEAPTIDGGGTVGLNSIKLTVPSAERHDGTEGTGARIVRSAAGMFTASVAATVEWMEFDANGNRDGVTGNGDTFQTFRNLLIHGLNGSITSVIGLNLDDGGCDALNCIVYDIENTKSGTALATGMNVSGKAANSFQVLNCTVDNCLTSNAGATTSFFGIEEGTGVSTVVKNTVVSRITTSGTGSPACFDTGWTGSATNASDDSSAPSAIAAEPVVASDEFTSIVGGSEDYHLKSGAECIDAGTDLVTTPSGVEIDIDGRDRDAQGDTWDVGADEFVSVGGGGAPSGSLALLGVGV